MGLRTLFFLGRGRMEGYGLPVSTPRMGVAFRVQSSEKGIEA